MKVKIRVDRGGLSSGATVDAAVYVPHQVATAYDSSGSLWTFYGGEFEILPEEEKQEPKLDKSIAGCFGQRMKTLNVEFEQERCDEMSKTFKIVDGLFEHLSKQAEGFDSTEAETARAAAFQQLCNKPEFAVDHANTNVLLVGNRRFAFMEGARHQHSLDAALIAGLRERNETLREELFRETEYLTAERAKNAEQAAEIERMTQTVDAYQKERYPFGAGNMMRKIERLTSALEEIANHPGPHLTCSNIAKAALEQAKERG